MSIVSPTNKGQRSLQDMQAALMGTVPGYEPAQALADMTRMVKSAKMQQAMQGQQAMQQAAASPPPIAQQIVQEAQQLHGVGGLPTGNYASGGIVSFAEGGYTGAPSFGQQYREYYDSGLPLYGDRGKAFDEEDKRRERQLDLDQRVSRIPTGYDDVPFNRKPLAPAYLPESLPIEPSEDSGIASLPKDTAASVGIGSGESARMKVREPVAPRMGKLRDYPEALELTPIQQQAMEAMTPEKRQAEMERLTTGKMSKYDEQMAPFIEYQKGRLEKSKEPTSRLDAILAGMAKAGPGVKGQIGSFLVGSAAGANEYTQHQEAAKAEIADRAMKAQQELAAARAAYENGQLDKAQAHMEAYRREKEAAEAIRVGNLKDVRSTQEKNYTQRYTTAKDFNDDVLKRDQINASIYAAQEAAAARREMAAARMAGSGGFDPKIAETIRKADHDVMNEIKDSKAFLMLNAKANTSPDAAKQLRTLIANEKARKYEQVLRPFGVDPAPYIATLGITSDRGNSDATAIPSGYKVVRE